MRLWLLWGDSRLLGVFSDEQLAYRHYNEMSSSMVWHKFVLETRDLNVVYEE